jgi:hypothetical protein
MSRHGDTRDSDAEDLNEFFLECLENELLSFSKEAIGSNVDEDNDEFSSQRPENERSAEPEENVDSDSNGDYDLYSDFVTDIPPPPDRAAYVHQRTRPARPGPSSIRIAPPLSRAQLDRAHYERIAKARRFYSPTLTANEYKFWFNRAHSQFLRRLRTQERFSIRRSIYLAALALYVSYDDFRVWHRLYGPVGAVLVATFAKKSIWKLQAEVLASVIDEIQWKIPYARSPYPAEPATG